MSTYIRPATVADEEAVSHICMVTGEAGEDATGLYTIPELLSIVWARPYLHAKNAFAYVLVTTLPDPNATNNENKESGAERVIGYIIGTTDAIALDEELAKNWWPAYVEKYPVESTPGNEKDKWQMQLMQRLSEPLTYEDDISHTGRHFHTRANSATRQPSLKSQAI